MVKLYLHLIQQILLYGHINRVKDNTTENSFLLIPIDKLEESHIDFANSSGVGLNSSVLNIDGIRIILPENSKIDLCGFQITENRYGFNTSGCEQVKKILGPNYDSKKEIFSEVLKKAPLYTCKEEQARDECIINCLAESFYPSSYHILETFSLDGEPYTDYEIKYKILNADKIRIGDSAIKKLHTKAMTIAKEIENYFSPYSQDSQISLMIDEFYRDLLNIYMKLNPKAKAEYYNEYETMFEFNKTRISSQPFLPPKDKDIHLHYSRTSEHIALKAIKLARLLNIFAHYAENRVLELKNVEDNDPSIIGQFDNDNIIQELENIRDKYYMLKKLVIERSIDYAKNTQIKMFQHFDEYKQSKAIWVVVPNYGIIQLHVLDRMKSLNSKYDTLPDISTFFPEGIKAMQIPAIMNGGVNSEFLLALRRLSYKERISFFMRLTTTAFYKLCIRMGVVPDFIDDIKNNRNKIICTLISDKNLDRLIKDTREYEKELLI